MAIIILAPETDSHAIFIEWGLRRAGYDVVRWEGLGWQPERHAALSFMEKDNVHLAGHKISSEDTVWFRRPQPAMQHPDVSPSEQKFARDEYHQFYKSFLLSIEWTGAFCVNKWSAAVLIEHKSIQLILARRCGLLVPTTTMTNSSGFVDELFNTVPGDIIHKAFLPHTWVNEASRMGYHCETTSLDRQAAYPEEVFAYAPGIYQQKIAKHCDVRITMIGEKFHAFAILGDKKMLDWRLHALQNEVSIERVMLPTDVESGLRKFANQARLVFGCFDMSVDEDGRWWFLEVNQAGQFLWIDDLCLDDGLYRPMLEFLSAREPSNKNCSRPDFATYRQCLAECEYKSNIPTVTEESRYVTIEK